MKTNTLICVIGVPHGGMPIVSSILESWGYDGGDTNTPRKILTDYWWWMDLKPKADNASAASRLHRYIAVRNEKDKQYFSSPFASLLMEGMNFGRTLINFIHIRREMESVVEEAIKIYPEQSWPIKRWRDIYRRIEERNERIADKNHHEVIAQISYEGLINSPPIEIQKISRPLAVNEERALASCGLVHEVKI